MPTETLSRYRWVILGLTFLAQLSNAVAAQAVAPLAPIFQPELGLTKAQVGVFSSAAFAGAWGFLLIAGSLTDRFGVRRMMVAGQTLTGLLILAMSAVGSYVQAVVVMLAAGLGRGATAPGVTKGVVDWFPQSARGTALGLNQTSIPIAGIVTASTLPALALTLGWRAAIATAAALILTGAILTALLYRESPETAPKRSKSGVGSNLRDALRNRDLWVVTAMGPLFAGAQFAGITYMALFMKEVVLVQSIPDEATRIVAAGGFLALFHVGGICARVLWGLVSDRVFGGRRAVVLVILGALSAGMSVVAGGLEAVTPPWLVGVVVLAYGATVMGWQGLYLVVAAEISGPRYAATGVGLCMTGTQLGFVAGPPLFGLILDLAGTYRTSWLFLAGLCALASLAGVAAMRREKPPAPHRACYS